jgi:hypothetical protein
MPILFRATSQPSTRGRSVRSKANRARWQSILETTHQSPRRYEDHPRAYTSIIIQGNMCAVRANGMSTLRD